MPTTMKLIGKVNLGADTASMTFSDVPATFTDLLIVGSFRSTRASPQVLDNMKIQLNSSASNFSWRGLFFEGTSVTSNSGTDNLVPVATAAGATSNTFSSVEIYIPNYAGTTNKSFSSTGLCETNAATAYGWVGAHLWSNTAAITSISLAPNAGANFLSASSAYLYGIKKS
jgi:hypothetical protein